MTTVHSLRHEFLRFRSAWQQIETFLDRIEEARDKDEEHATRTRALILAAAAIERERRLRDGSGLDLPLELAQKRPSGGARRLQKHKKFAEEAPRPVVRAGFGDDPLLSELTAPTDATPPPAVGRLPGAYDLEIAVANIVPDTEGGELIDMTRVVLPATLELYSRHDDREGALVERVVPRYDTPIAAPVRARVALPESTLFDVGRRLKAAQGKANGEPARWTSLRDLRSGYAELTSSVRAHLDAMHVHPVAHANLADALDDLADAAGRGAADLADAATALQGEDLGPDLSPETLADAGTRMAARKTLYAGVARALRDPRQPALDQKLAQLAALLDEDPEAALYSRTGHGGAAPLNAALDEEVAARIAYPDGTLRLLRAMEGALHGVWTMYTRWFEARTGRYLRPLLIARFLRGLALGLWRAHLKLPTGAALPGGLPLDPSRPAVLGGTFLQFAAPAAGGSWKLGDVVAAQLAFVDGPRRTLAVLLGDVSTVGPRAPDSPAETLQRLQVTPLRISTSRSRGRGDVPGMIVADPTGPAARLVTQLPSGAYPGDGDITRGTIDHRPQDDGLVHELVALWSRLCLVLGTAAVGDLVDDHALVPPGATPPATRPRELPSALPIAARIPLARGVGPHERRLVIALDALRRALRAAGKQVADDAVPIVARPGELLLVRGPDEHGAISQGVVEVVSVTRTSTENIDAAPANPLGNLVCCDPPGDVLVIEVLDTPFPRPLVAGRDGDRTLVLHRDFRGFGAPSLATRVVLPHAMDDSDATAGEKPAFYRGLELDAACKAIDSWMYPPS